jgi:hypothetical protein
VITVKIARPQVKTDETGVSNFYANGLSVDNNIHPAPENIRWPPNNYNLHSQSPCVYFGLRKNEAFSFLPHLSSVESKTAYVTYKAFPIYDPHT